LYIATPALQLRAKTNITQKNGVLYYIPNSKIVTVAKVVAEVDEVVAEVDEEGAATQTLVNTQSTACSATQTQMQ
jgi:hypothetical protein